MKTIIYTSPTCPWSKDCIEYFTKNSIEFEERDLSEESSWRIESVTKSGQLTTPLLDINGTIIVGFDEKQIQAALNAN